MNQEERNKQMGKLIAKCWADEDFKKELLSNPSAVFKDNGIDIPEGMEVKVVENTATTVHFILPPKPAEGELSDVDLDGVAGGLGNVFVFVWDKIIKSIEDKMNNDFEWKEDKKRWERK